MFDEVWDANLAWIPNCTCPADTHFWLDVPAPLNAHAIRGTGKLLTMFGRHTYLGATKAATMREAVPVRHRNATWQRIRARIDAEGNEAVNQDLGDIEKRRGLKPTVRRQLVNARLGRCRLRREVERLWDRACSVSGCSLRETLRASHIKPWKPSNDVERLHGENGLVLTADLNALFYKGLISFADDGDMLIANRVGKTERSLLRLPRPLRKTPTGSQRRYLADHRHQWAFI